MRRNAWVIGLGSAAIAVSSLCGCSWEELFPSNSPTLPNAVAVDRALRLCSLSEGDQPFHLVLDISPPARDVAVAHGIDERALNLRFENMRAEVEIYWLNPITYRIVIRSRDFSQTRIVNGSVIEEHDAGDFYPRWIQNFVDAILDPVPKASFLRRVPGAVPIGVQSHACISSPAIPGASAEDTASAQICFQDIEPRIASGVEFTRSVWFDDFAPFGAQQIARTLVNDLPANILVRSRVIQLESLRKSDYSLLRAAEFTPPEKQIRTMLVPRNTAESLLDIASGKTLLPVSQRASSETPTTVYIRTDRRGQVREAYSDSSDHFGLQDAAVFRALTLRFKPLMVNGIPQQMEAPLVLESSSLLPHS
ncbi:hypothetical protein [Acidicapsa acidisoli]|uniref:hypothetical protein n=1 Tax=Acidicapsa acidisoli TaxID=1615681 RepID=UPI0021E08C39|nr:hypothetical protein [Acidicapsa acidisoli]